MKHGMKTRRIAAGLAVLMTLSSTFPAAAAELSPTSDETYYATLDYYGTLTDSSVVKSIRTFGTPVLKDYGVYDEVVNLTDSRAASAAGGEVTFDLTGDVPENFYFEGKTARPYEQFPWKLSLSYALNGVPARAEDLAGQKGVVEITLNAVPNPAASEYSRNNLVLTAMSVFNGDDILSLEAPGAQVQVIGNLRCVLYAVLPGEEQRFTIRVGSEDFAYSGMIFLAVPATLQQLEQVNDLREAKEKGEDSYHAVQDSLDVILDTLEGMSGSLNATASGLDQLNQARNTVSAGKDAVYDSLDIALDAAGPLSDSIRPMQDHLSAAQQAVRETNALLNQMSENVVGLKPEVEETRQLLAELKTHLTALQDLSESLEGYPSDVQELSDQLSGDFTKLGSALGMLQKSLDDSRDDLEDLEDLANGIDSKDGKVAVSVGGNTLTIAEVKALVAQAEGAYSQYEGALAAGLVPEGTTFQQFLVLAGGKSEEEAAQIEALLNVSQSDSYKKQMAQAESLQGILDQSNLTVDQLQGFVGDVSDSIDPVLRHLSSVCDALDSGHLSGRLSELCGLLSDLMHDLDQHNGTLSDAADTLKNAADLGVRVSANVDTALEQVEALTGIMNTYDPNVQQALEDAKTFAASASAGLDALTQAARDAEDLLKNSGSALDRGTQQTLSNLADALRRSTRGLDQTGVIRDAKETIDSLVSDEWNSHVGEDNNLLLMDAGAAPVSLTDSRNQGVSSIQYVMRTQEIKADEAETPEETASVPQDNGTVWTRILAMFRDLWNAFTGLFR